MTLIGVVLLFVASGVSYLVLSDRAEGDKGIEELAVSECSELRVGTRDLQLCTRAFDNGFTSIVLRSDGVEETSTSLIVDLGGPVVPIDDLQSHMLEIAELDADGMFSTLLAVAVPLPGETSIECRTAGAGEMANLCGFPQIETLYTAQYFDVVEAELDSFAASSTSVQILGASYAASRWYRIDTVVDDPSFTIDRSVYVSPLMPGTDVMQLSSDVFDAAERLFSRGIEEGCWSAECLSSVNLLEPCRGCDLIERLTLVTGSSSSEVEQGLAGLSPLVELNGPLLGDALASENGERLAELLARGRESFLGLGLSGGLHIDTIHLLAVSCPVLSGNVRLAGAPYSHCGSLGSMDRLDIEASDSADSMLLNTCFVSTQPDPVLGLATTRGGMFGNGAGFTVQDRTLGHGNLDVGLEYLKRKIVTRRCPQ